MRNFLFFIILFIFLLLSCKQEKKNNAPYPIVATSEIISSFNSFWTYWNNEVFLTRDFIALDTNNTVIARNIFLQKLTLGNYLPLRLSNEKQDLIYQLYKIHTSEVNEEITRTIKQYAKQFYTQSQMEGKTLPEFSFIDINGNVYNQRNCEGKIVVLNCWFIHCMQCVLEIPNLNKLVQQYPPNKNVVFIALGLDNNEQLKNFLSKTKFDYAIVGNMENYLTKQLGVATFPTQIIVDKRGKIFRYMETYDDLKYELEKLTK